MLTIRIAGEAGQQYIMELSLHQDVDGVVAIRGRDALDRLFIIGWSTPDGLLLNNKIPQTTGWPLDSDGRIKVVPK